MDSALWPRRGAGSRPPCPIQSPNRHVLLSLKDGQLVAQGENLDLELGTGPKPVSYDHGQKSQGITHAPTLPRFGQTQEFLRRMGFSEGTGTKTGLK